MPRKYDMSDIDTKNIISVSPSAPVALSDIRMYQLYRVVSDPNTVDDTGRAKILEMIQQINLRDPEWDKLLPEGFDAYDWNGGRKNRILAPPDDWCWKNTVENKKNPLEAKYGTGKFAKRFRTYVLKEQGINLPDKFIQDLGQIAGRYSDQSTGTVLRFVDKFDWNAGDFGDSGSCFWGGREEARDILAEHGAWAVQMFEPESIEKAAPVGLARAWIIPNYPIKGVMTMFNGYGKNMGDPARVIARVLATLVGLTSYGEIKLQNQDTSDGTLYINSGRGFVIGTPSEKLQTHYDLKWPEKILGECCHCEEDIVEGADHADLHGRLYCESCGSDHIHYDEIVGENFDPDYEGGTYMRNKNRFGDGVSEIYVMDRTFERYGGTCDECGECFHDDLLTVVETSGHYYCQDCLLDIATVCDGCSSLHETRTMDTRIDSNDNELLMCEVCVDEWDEAHPLENENDKELETVNSNPFAS